MKLLFKISLLLILFSSCSSKQTTLEQYLNYPVKFAKKEIKEPNGNYSLFVPKDWELVSNNHLLKDNRLLSWNTFISDTGNYENNIDIFIIKDERNIEKCFKEVVDAKKFKTSYKDDNIKIINSGKTNVLSYASYFVHTSHSNIEYVNNNKKTIHFILQSEEENIYYHLVANKLKGENQKQNMSMMLNCLKTFKIND